MDEKLVSSFENATIIKVFMSWLCISKVDLFELELIC